MKEFQRNLSKADREKAEATLAAEVDKGGFNVFSGLVSKADMARADAELGFDVDAGGLARAKAAQAVLTKESSKLSDVFDRSQLSIGQWTGILAASLPVVLDLAGALGALTASLGAATAGLGTLGVGAGGALTVGLAGIASVAAPAIASLGDLKTAQDAYTEAVDRYGKESTQAETALTKLAFEQKRAGPLATKLAGNLRTLTRRWKELTQAGQTDFIGLMNDGVTRLNQKLPMLAESANSSMKALRRGFDAFLDRATGPGFNHFIHVMTRTFAKSIGPISRAFGNIAVVLERLAVAVAPDIVRMVKGFEGMTQGWVDSTRNAADLRRVVHGLVEQTEAWWDLIKATAKLIIAVLVPGMGQGKRAVEGITATLKEWTAWVKGHPKEMENFFKEGLETTKQLAQALLSFLPSLVEISQAMRPIARAFLALLKGLNTLKVGNVSALTVLLGAIVATKMVKGVNSMVGAFGRLKAAALGAAVAEKAALTPTLAKGPTVVPDGGLRMEGGKVVGGPAVAPVPTGLGKARAFLGDTAKMAKYAKVAGGVAVAVTAVAGAFMALRDNFLGVRDVFTGFFDKVLKPIGDAFTDLVNQLSGGHAAQIFGAIGDALGTIAKPLEWVLKNMTKLVGLLAIGAIAAPFVLAIAAIAAPVWVAIKATTLFVKALKAFVGFIRKGAWDKLGHLLGAPFRAAWDVARRVVGFIRDKIKGLIDWVKSNWIGSRLDLGAPFRAMWDIAKRAFNFVREKAGAVMGWVRERWGSITHVLTAPFRAMKSVVKSVFDWIKNKVEWLMGKIETVVDKIKSVTDKIPSLGGGPQPTPDSWEMSPAGERAARRAIRRQRRAGGEHGGLVTPQGISWTGFQHGGIVGQKGLKPGSKDTIPAMLQVGELVIPKEMVDKTKKNAKLTAAAMTGELGKGHKEASKDTEKFVKNHGKAWEKLRSDTARTTTKFRKGTVDDFQKTSKTGEQTTDKMRQRVSDGFGKMRGNAVESSSKMRSGVGEDFRRLSGAVGDGLRRIGQMTNNALRALGVKKVNFSIGVQGKQRGGLIPGTGDGDKVPVMAEPGEGFINKKAVKAMGGKKAIDKINAAVPRFQKGGTVKGGMSAMVAEANKFERRHFPYSWGGGHGGFGIQPVDCSGAVSQVLHAAGLLSAPMTSGGLMNWGKPGKGPLTVYTNPHHVVMSLNGKVFGTSGSNPGGGAGWIEGARGEALAPGAVRTMDVAGAVARQVKRLALKGPKGPLKDMGQATLDKVRGAANKYIDKKMGGRFGGGQADIYQGKLDKIFPTPGPPIAAWQAAMLAEKAGLPGITYAQIAKGESALRPGAVSPDGGYGLWQMTPRVQSPSTVAAWKAIGSYFNPWNNARMAKVLAGSGTGVSNYFGTGFWDGTIKHWHGEKNFQKGGMVPYVGSFDKGGTVPQTGLGLLHKGEEVLSMQRGGMVGLERTIKRLQHVIDPHPIHHARERRRREREERHVRQQQAREDEKARLERLQRETRQETRERHRRERGEERRRDRREKRQQENQWAREQIQATKELVRDLREHNRLYKTLRQNDKAALGALVDLTSAQIGAQGLQKTRLAGWGVDRRY